jgi:inner membrane protein
METTEKMIKGLFNSVGFKLAFIAFISLILLIPAAMIMELIREREQRHDETISEVTAIWGKTQTICGPVLTIPIRSEVNTGQQSTGNLTRYAHFLPENLRVVGTLEPEVRYRGIYRVVAYRAKIHVSGNFSDIDLTSLSFKGSKPEGDLAWIEIGISDMRGINHEIKIHLQDSVLSVIPGIPGKEISASGVHCLIPITHELSGSFAFDLDLNGSSALRFLPLGKRTDVRLSSSWNAPSFTGAFLPDVRKIDKNGFSADWNILHVNRNFPQQWTDNQYSTEESAFGVDLITPVDTYQKSMRSVKYAILFIGLTFLVFFFSEVFTGLRIHPVNYFLVGISLCVFYSLLTALAEHLGFTAAYLISSLTIISLIGIFAHALYKRKKITAVVVVSLSSLYAFLFVILQLTDYSLLFGNIGLVLVLALVMYFSRKVDWYSPMKDIRA